MEKANATVREALAHIARCVAFLRYVADHGIERDALLGLGHFVGRLEELTQTVQQALPTEALRLPLHKVKKRAAKHARTPRR